MLHYYSWIFLYHLSYYSLGHRIKVLRLYLKEDVEIAEIGAHSVDR